MNLKNNMLRILTHKASSFGKDESIKGSLIVPAGAKSLTGVLVTSTATIGKVAKTGQFHQGFDVKIQIDNKVLNPINNSCSGTADFPEFKNLTEKRWIKTNVDLIKSSRIDYTIIARELTQMENNSSGIYPDTSLKLYLKFE